MAVEMNPKAKQGDLIAAIEPVADRLLKRFERAQEKSAPPLAKDDAKAAEEAKGEINAPVLFKADLGAAQRMLQLPVADIRLWQHVPSRKNISSSTRGFCRCWSLGANVKASICRR